MRMIQRGERKGQELSVGTLILIVLGVIILVLLVFGFYYGWDNIGSKIGSLIGGGAKGVDSVKEACNLAANAGTVSEFCKVRPIKIEKTTYYQNCLGDKITDLDKTLECDGSYVLNYCATAKAETVVNGVKCDDVKKAVSDFKTAVAGAKDKPGVVKALGDAITASANLPELKSKLEANKDAVNKLADGNLADAKVAAVKGL